MHGEGYSSRTTLKLPGGVSSVAACGGGGGTTAGVLGPSDAIAEIKKNRLRATNEQKASSQQQLQRLRANNNYGGGEQNGWQDQFFVSGSAGGVDGVRR